MSKENTEISERVSQIIDYVGVSPNEFAKELGYNRSQSVYDIINGKSKPSFDFFNKLYSTGYSEIINPNWLLTGNGSMLNNKENSVLIEDEFGIPLIPINAMAGWGRGDVQIMENEASRYVVRQFDNIPADYMIKIEGSSMEKTFFDGDLVACKSLPLDTFFQWNKVYVLDTIQGAMIKRVKKSDENNHILCVSDNPEYDPFNLSIENIFSLSIVLKGISFRTP